MKVRRIAVTSLAVAGVTSLLWLFLANPYNFFVPRSAHFSTSRFKSIDLGTPIADAIKLLGEPVKIVKEDRFDPSCPSCTAYCFMGEPPDWVISFQEAWLIADHQGRVTRVFINSEP